jgi:prevent-host-death family protein
MQSWQLQAAKARRSELIRLVKHAGPHAISVHGQEEVVILSKQDYEQLIGKKDPLVTFMQKSPLKGLHLEFARDRSKAREIQL